MKISNILILIISILLFTTFSKMVWGVDFGALEIFYVVSTFILGFVGAIIACRLMDKRLREMEK